MGWLDAVEATRALGVKRATLYAYASRGLVRTRPADDGRGKRYHEGDIDDLRLRAEAHRGHAATAAGALRWGEPVVDSSITSIDRDGPNYRGLPAVTLAERGAGFEAVAELLWTGELPAAPPAWPSHEAPDDALCWVPATAAAMQRFALVVPALAVIDAGGDGAGADHGRARRLVRAWVASLAVPERREAVAAATSVADALAVALGCPTRAGDIDRALILVADHELNVSSFAARVAASSGADLYSAVAAALGAVSGPLHGGACDRIEVLLGDPAARVDPLVRARAPVPGFGHRLYPDGDPRAEALLEGLAVPPAVEALITRVRAAGYPPPTIDLALVALGLPRGAATALFAIGRVAGWVAHILEQRAAGVLLRPRARYVGS